MNAFYRIGQYALKSNSCKILPLLKGVKSLNPNCFQIFSTNADNESWRIVYKWPLVRWVAAFNKLKIYQTALTTIGIPISYSLVEMGELPNDIPFAVASLGITGIVTLSLCSLAFRNMVGIVYINNEEDKVKLAYVDYWGRRKHELIDVKHILSQWDSWSDSRIQFYLPIRLEDGEKQCFKLIQRFGVITDKQVFIGLFGD